MHIYDIHKLFQFKIKLIIIVIYLLIYILLHIFIYYTYIIDIMYFIQFSFSQIKKKQRM